MKHTKSILGALYVAAAGLLPVGAWAQTTYTENFTGATTTNPWTFITGACLTAGSAAGAPTNPGCVGLPYYAGDALALIGGTTGTLPDAVNTGALRFTDDFAQTGALLSQFSFPLTGAGAAGLQVSFTTVTYEGNSGGAAGDGADGISFFLQDASQAPDVGAFGGSLGYTCTNVNFNGTLRPTGIPRGYDGLQGGFIGLGIDEYGNFLNQGDNTASGFNYHPERIGIRGPGGITWASLNAAYPVQYPSTLTNAQGAAAVQNSCRTGFVWDYSNPAAPVQTLTPLTDNATANTGDYPALAFSLLPATKPIANEAATKRSQAVPITYNLQINPQTTTTGANIALLSLSYSYNGGALQNVISNQDITNGGTVPVPPNVRFGFAGSTGGSRNIHEIMCFNATPANVAQSSGGLNQKQTAKVQTGTQVYFAYYNPTTLAGSLTSQNLGPPVGDPNPNDLIISSVINWDGSCVLTGVPAGQSCDTTTTTTGPAGPILAEGPLSRTILTWQPPSGATPGTGIPFEWANLTANQQAALDYGDGVNWIPAPPFNYSRLNYLRGDRSNEQTPTSSVTFIGTFRARASVLGDIIDSSPTWVGPPDAALPNVWTDKFNAAGDPMAENLGPTYANYVAAMQTRTNVVYAGANDGLLHGFRSGYFSAPNVYQSATNDGQELLAYMPGYIVNTIQTLATAASNYSDPQYGHHFDVDAAPGTGDLFYGGQWHTWLVGGLGPGGNAIYALDVTNPGLTGANNFSEAPAAAASTVIGEWSLLAGVTNLNCLNDTTTACGMNLGLTYGVPQIRRFHNGSWGAVFGNGQRSANGDGGVYVMLVDPGSGAVTFYYFSTQTGSVAVPNGIDFTAAADLDGDHITDYVYAGDLQGNIWRFDLTSTNPSNWGVTNAKGASISATGPNGGGSPTPLFTTAGGSAQPITTQVVVTSVAGATNPRVLVEFGTGKETAMTNFSGPQYLNTQQALYGIWDWNLSVWNAQAALQYASLPALAPLVGNANLQVQTIGGPFTATVAGTGSDYRTLTSNPVCYADVTGCTAALAQYGWYIQLVSGNAHAADPADPSTGNPADANAPLVYEQVTFNPVYDDGAFIVNTTIPPAAAAIMCYSAGQSGWTMAVNPATGGAFTNSFFGDPSHHYLNIATGVGEQPVSGIAVGGTGSPSVVVGGTQPYIVTQTVTGQGFLDSINPPGGMKGTRLTWTEKR